MSLPYPHGREGECSAMDLELKHYNQKEVWEIYAENTTEIARAKETVTYIPDEVASVLDIGCGNGIITNLIDREVVIGMDFADLPLRNVKKDAIRASIDSLPFKEGTFDLVLMTEVLEHLPNRVYRKALREIGRLQAKYLLISIPFEENLEANQCKCGSCGSIFHPAHHYRTFNEDWFVEEFPDYDAMLVRYTTYKTAPNPHLVRLRHRCRTYSGYRNASCPECGGRAAQPRIILRYAFGALDLLDKKVKESFRITRPCHQVVLLMRR